MIISSNQGQIWLTLAHLLPWRMLGGRQTTCASILETHTRKKGENWLSARHENPSYTRAQVWQKTNILSHLRCAPNSCIPPSCKCSTRQPSWLSLYLHQPCKRFRGQFQTRRRNFGLSPIQEHPLEETTSMSSPRFAPAFQEPQMTNTDDQGSKNG